MPSTNVTSVVGFMPGGIWPLFHHMGLAPRRHSSDWPFPNAFFFFPLMLFFWWIQAEANITWWSLLIFWKELPRNGCWKEAHNLEGNFSLIEPYWLVTMCRQPTPPSDSQSLEAWFLFAAPVLQLSSGFNLAPPKSPQPNTQLCTSH